MRNTMKDIKGINNMKCWIFRHFQENNKMKAEDVIEVFKEFKVNKYIDDNFDYLHLSSYALALKDVEKYIEYKKGILCKN